MPPEYLTKDTFEAWANGFSRELKEIAAVRDKVDEHGVAIAVLQDRSTRDDRRAGGIAAFVSAGVTAAIAGIKFWFFGTHA